MKNRAFTYFTSIFFGLVFFAKDILVAMPALLNKVEWISLHDYDAEEESQKTKNETGGNSKLSEAREFLAEHDFHYQIHSLITGQDTRLRPGNTFLEKSFYPSIPTPPPDKA